MNSSNSFKVFFDVTDKTVVTKGNFLKFPDYKLLRKEIVNCSQKGTFKSGKKNLNERDNFVLEVFEAEGPILEKKSQLPPIFNSKTYKYFIEKLTSCSQDEISKVKFSIKKVEKLPSWNPPQYQETLQKALIDTYSDMKKSLSKELSEHKLVEGKEEFNRKRYETEPQLKDCLYNGTNINIICRNCFKSNFYGIRYICAECKDYNLCEQCYHHILNYRLHDSEHTFIQVKKPIIEESNTFSNIISPKFLYFDDKKTSFGVKFTVVNNGEMNLACCFIVPVRYGNKYLSCLKKTITDSVEKNDKTEVEMMIKFPEDDQADIYEGYFRMFTESGVPFGDVLYVKALKKKD